MSEGFINQCNGAFVSTDERIPMLRVDVCRGGKNGTGLDLVVLAPEVMTNAELRKCLVRDLRKLLVDVENWKGGQA